MFNDAKAQYEQGILPKALADFQTLLFLLNEERTIPAKMISKVESYIQRINDPAGFAKTQQQAQLKKQQAKALEKKTAQLTAQAEEFEIKANDFFQANEFEQASIFYRKQGNVLKQLNDVKPSVLATNYWNLGFSLEAWACLPSTSMEQAQKLKSSALECIIEARKAYPKIMVSDIQICNETIARLTQELETPTDEVLDEEIPVLVLMSFKQKSSAFNKDFEFGNEVTEVSIDPQKPNLR